MTTTKERIRNLIRMRPGHKNPLETSRILNSLPDTITSTELAKIISELIIYEKALIGNTESGYFWITNTEDLTATTGYTLQLLKLLITRLSALKFNFKDSLTHVDSL